MPNPNQDFSVTAATAENSRTQVWQWNRHPKGILDDGRKITEMLFKEILKEELDAIRQTAGENNFREGKYEEAAELFSSLTVQAEFVEFLTLPGYEKLN